MEILSVKNLNKRYEKFELKDVSFSLEKGYIMGFIGRNGAGKTTTLKCILNLAQKNNGEVKVMGKDFKQNELELKQQIGFMFGGVDYYLRSRIKKMTEVTRRFYPSWDDGVYASYMRRFEIDESKKISELSHGMRVKYSLALALSHNAKLLLLDEPTSGLVPIARDDLLELFQELIEDGGRSILFSTHITSDLEKCADYITYIQNGRIVEDKSKDELIASYRIVKGAHDMLGTLSPRLISYKTNTFGFTGLIKTADLGGSGSLTVETPTLEEIMIYHEKKEADNEKLAV